MGATLGLDTACAGRAAEAPATAESWCGCCPLDVCPNLQLSCAALRAVGFTRLRALMLPASIGRDRVSQGLPVEG